MVEDLPNHFVVGINLRNPQRYPTPPFDRKSPLEWACCVNSRYRQARIVNYQLKIYKMLPRSNINDHINFIRESIYFLITFTLCIVALPIPLSSQSQLGLDIEGEASFDQSGWSVSLSADGNRVAIGAPNNDGNGDDSGHVRVFEWINGVWIQVGTDIDGESPGDQSGSSVSLSSDGNRVAIGSPYNVVNGTNSGHVRVYEWMNGAWAKLGMNVDGENAQDRLGWSVSLSADGNRLAIGALGFGGDDIGQVRVYEWMNGAWTQMGMEINGEAPDDVSGSSVSMSSDGNRLAIGSAFNDGNGNDSGHVRVFEWMNGAWTQVGMDIDGESPGDQSGRSVSLSANGNRVAIGADNNNDNGAGSGHVRVFEWMNGEWTQLGMDIDGEDSNDGSGWSVALSSDGNRVAIGAQMNNDNGLNSGHVRVYEWMNGEWTQVGMDIDGEMSGEFLGRAVSISSDGSRAAIGAPQNMGRVRVYELIVSSNLEDIYLNKTLILFPNPSSGKLFISNEVNVNLIRIMNSSGTIVFSQQNKVEHIDISYLPSGLYFVEMLIDDNWINEKIVKN